MRIRKGFELDVTASSALATAAESGPAQHALLKGPIKD
jgi:hypothetical protein